jgi:hypothetical protein
MSTHQLNLQRHTTIGVTVDTLSPIPARNNLIDEKFTTESPDHRLGLFGYLFDLPECFWIRHAGDDRNLRLDNPCFFQSDSGERISQLLGMVSADATDHRHVWLAGGG